MAKTQTQTQTQTQAANKAANNTPVSGFASYVARVTDKKQAAALQAAHVKAQSAKKEQAEKKNTSIKGKGVFSLVAGMVVSIEHKALKKAIDYHCKQGNLCKVSDGIKLTKQGADDWNKNRVLANPEGFQKIAAFVNGGANLPEFGGERKTPVKVGNNKQLPSLEFWGSFATANMRLCFASLWASK